MRDTRWLKWMTLNVGDPLYTPFPAAVPSFDGSLAVKMNVFNTEIVDPLLSGLWFPQSSIEGGTGVTAMVLLNASAPDGGLTVQLSSDTPNAAAVPAVVLVPGGATQASFVVTTSPVTSSTDVNINAGLLGAQATTVLTVVP